MSIPSPINNYDYNSRLYSYGGGSPLENYGEPWSNYGLEGYGDGGGGYLQQYSYYRQQALQALQNGGLPPQQRQAWQTYLNQLEQWFQQYGSASQNMSGGGWDPNSGNLGDSYGGMENSANPGIFPSYQDQNKRIYEDSVGGFQADKNMPQGEAHFYDYAEMDFLVPGSAKATVTKDADGTLRATVTWPTGATKTYFFQNNKHVNFLAGDPDKQIVQDASLQGDERVSTGVAGTEDPMGVQGDLPGRRKDGKLGWDGESFDIFSSSDGKEKFISARGEVRFHASSNSEYWTVAWDEASKQYVIRVYADQKDADDPKKAKETFRMDDMTNFKATFDIDPSRIEFLGVLKGSDEHTLSSSNSHAGKLSFASEATGAGLSLNSDFPEDTAPDEVNGNTATYSKSHDVEIHTHYGDAVKVHDITAPGNVVIHGESYGDTMKVGSYDSNTHTWIIYVTNNKNETETFIVHGNENTQVTLDTMNPVEGDTSGIQTGGSSEGDTSGIDTSGDTAPDKKNGTTWEYNGYESKDVSLHAISGHDANIDVTGNVEVKLSVGQKAKVTKDGSGNYKIEVKDSTGKTISTLTVDKSAKSIDIQGPESAVDHSAIPSEDEKLKIDGAAMYGTSKDVEEIAKKLKDLDCTYDQFHYFHANYDKWAKDTAHLIGEALVSGNWDGVKSKFTFLDGQEPGHRDNYAECLFQLLRLHPNIGENGLKTLLTKMPSDIKSKWTGALGADPSYVNAASELSSNVMAGSWVTSNNAHLWTHQASIDFIKSVESSSEDDDE